MGKYQLLVHGSKGYGADQVKGIKVEDLKFMLADLKDEDEIVLYDDCNAYGAQFGELTDYVEEADEEDE